MPERVFESRSEVVQTRSECCSRSHNGERSLGLPVFERSAKTPNAWLTLQRDNKQAVKNIIAVIIGKQESSRREVRAFLSTSLADMRSVHFRRIILDQMKTCLKPAGFRKKQAVFAHERADAVLFIQLQSSLKSTKDLLIVTVNLGIFSRVVAENMRNTHEPNILEAHWRKRIGHFASSESDKWWDVRSDEEAERCGSEISSILGKNVLPVMLSLASAENLKSLWLTGQSPGLTDYERKQFLQALEGIDILTTTRRSELVT